MYTSKICRCKELNDNSHFTFHMCDDSKVILYAQLSSCLNDNFCLNLHPRRHLVFAIREVSGKIARLHRPD